MKVAIITGATSGIGREAALLIDERFDSLDEIWIVGRNEEKLDELSELLRHSVRTFAMDLTKDTELDAFEAVVAKLNPNIRMLFNCAGAGLHGYFHEMNRLEETEMIRLNCESLTTMTAICIPYMRKGARVLNFSRAIRFELIKKGIVVTTVCPGPVNTNFFQNSEKYTGGVSSFKKKFMDSPNRVVRKALDDAGLCLPVSINSPIMEVGAFVSKYTPVETFVTTLGLFDMLIWNGKK